MASTSIPKTMRGILIEETGPSSVLKYRTDLPVPTPKDGEVLVKNAFCGINYIDTYFRTGLYPAPKPEILGKEAAGTVVSPGPNPHPTLPTGARVAYISNNAAYAEYSTAPIFRTTVVPDAISLENAAASMMTGLTTLTLTAEAYAVQRGDWVLVTAASGGVGQWMCQVLRSKGARTIAVASTKEKQELARKNGADEVCGYGEMVERVGELTGGKGVKAVFDSVGKDTWERSLECVARKGTVVSYGNASGAVPPFAISKLTAKNVKVCRPTFMNYVADKEEFDVYTKELWKTIIEDKFTIQIHKIYSLEDVRQAHDDLEGRGTTGKLLLKV